MYFKQKNKKGNFVLYIKRMRKQIISEEFLYNLFFIVNANNNQEPQRTPINSNLLFKKYSRPEKEDSSQGVSTLPFKVSKIP